MASILLIAEETETAGKLVSDLGRHGFACSFADTGEAEDLLTTFTPDITLLNIEARNNLEALFQILRKRNLSSIALISLEIIDSIDGKLETDDFIISPCDMRELVLRINRLLKKNARSDADIIRCGDLTIDTARCEVTIAGFSKILTFKEYELLKFLAGKPGHVFTRNVLLDRVWGHDYLGGDRTVDVHVRRLRSKIEDSSLCHIETVRNIGYRFSINA